MPSNPRGVAQQKEPAPKQKRKPVRRDPEKRRQQNNQAQKRYREKLRGRLDRLEALAEFAAQSRGTRAKSAAGPGAPEIVIAHDLSSSPSENTTIAGNDIPPPGVLDVLGGSLDATTDGYQQFVPHQAAETPTTLDPGLWDPSSYASAPSSDDTSMLGIWDPTTLSLPPDDTISYEYPATNAQHSDQTLSEESIWNAIAQPLQSTTSSVPEISPSTALSTTSPPTKNHNNRQDLCWTSTIQCGCTRPHFQIQSQGPRAFASTNYNLKILSLEPGAPAADPYANNLRIDNLCTITALYAVGTHLGIAEDLICADESLSPFFQPTRGPLDPLTETNMVTAVQAVYKKTLRPDVRPTRKQIIVSHHPYIDILPFPTLRNNLITRQGEFDEDDFFHDSLVGLVCWGGGGVGKRDRNVSTGKVSTGTPWDVRSWEAHGWFLKKYWDLLGGEEGELARQTEWWRGIRGDDALDIADV